ncbi:MAG: 50S ribosomal protein L21 [Holosporales bacterium]|jgi:large subunit ribosomal protein L21|nr:50S ribosomal protein L21 [Holosporales bacterium]
MNAVVRTGGKQYIVKPGDVLKIEKIDAEPKAVVSLSDIVMIQHDDGRVVTGADLTGEVSVTAEVLKHVRDKKVIVFKKKRRHNYRRKRGHRQWATVLMVKDILESQVSQAS